MEGGGGRGGARIPFTGKYQYVSNAKWLGACKYFVEILFSNSLPQPPPPIPSSLIKNSRKGDWIRSPSLEITWLKNFKN